MREAKLYKVRAMEKVLRFGRRILLILMWGGGSAWAERALIWEPTVIEIAAKEGDKEAEAAFTFNNGSETPVTIRQISTSCGCTTAAVDKKEYLPGESGIVRAKFLFGDRKGHQQKTIIVKTSEAEAPRYILTFRVEIPGGVRLSAKSLTWSVGETPEPRYIDLTVSDPGTGSVSDLRSDAARFEANLEEIEPKKRHRISVRPTNVEKPMFGVLQVRVADPKPRVIRIPLRVEP